jgi:hypothetical protein
MNGFSSDHSVLGLDGDTRPHTHVFDVDETDPDSRSGCAVSCTRLLNFRAIPRASGSTAAREKSIYSARHLYIKSNPVPVEYMRKYACPALGSLSDYLGPRAAALPAPLCQGYDTSVN